MNIVGVDSLLFVNGLRYLFYAVGISVITWGVFQSVYMLLTSFSDPAGQGNFYKKARLVLCKYIVFGLEYMVAGDVIHTMVVTDYQTIILLGGMVIIRTVLSYFVDLEMKSLQDQS